MDDRPTQRLCNKCRSMNVTTSVEIRGHRVTDNVSEIIIYQSRRNFNNKGTVASDHRKGREAKMNVEASAGRRAEGSRQASRLQSRATPRRTGKTFQGAKKDIRRGHRPVGRRRPAATAEPSFCQRMNRMPKLGRQRPRRAACAPISSTPAGFTPPSAVCAVATVDIS